MRAPGRGNRSAGGARRKGLLWGKQLGQKREDGRNVGRGSFRRGRGRGGEGGRGEGEWRAGRSAPTQLGPAEGQSSPLREEERKRKHRGQCRPGALSHSRRHGQSSAELRQETRFYQTAHPCVAAAARSRPGGLPIQAVA